MLNHLSEEEIQLYLFEKDAVPAGVAAHLDVCKECKARLETYRLLVTGIEQQQAPAFDFDLQQLVLPQLAPPAPAAADDRLLKWIFILAGIAFTGIAVWLSRDYLESFFDGITALVTSLVIVTTVIILSALSIDMFKTYRKKMNSLDMYQ